MTSTLVVTIFTYSIYAAFRINKDAIKEMSFEDWLNYQIHFVACPNNQ